MVNDSARRRLDSSYCCHPVDQQPPPVRQGDACIAHRRSRRLRRSQPSHSRRRRRGPHLALTPATSSRSPTCRQLVRIQLPMLGHPLMLADAPHVCGSPSSGVWSSASSRPLPPSAHARLLGSVGLAIVGIVGGDDAAFRARRQPPGPAASRETRSPAGAPLASTWSILHECRSAAVQQGLHRLVNGRGTRAAPQRWPSHSRGAGA